jgi:hypothetical protein
MTIMSRRKPRDIKSAMSEVALFTGFGGRRDVC